MRPVVSNTAEDFYEGLVPWQAPDEAMDWHLLKFVAGVTEHLSIIDDLVRDTDDHIGWSPIMDADFAEPQYFPWLGQFVGVTVDAGLSDDDQRQQLKNVAGFRRGTVASIIAAAQPYLTGTKSVTIDERDTSAYHFQVRTFTAETPDPAKVLAALLAQKPAGLVMEYSVSDGLTYDEIAASGLTYDDLTAAYPTSDALKHAQTI